MPEEQAPRDAAPIGVRNFAGVSANLDTPTKKYVDDAATLTARPKFSAWTVSFRNGYFSPSEYTFEQQQSSPYKWVLTTVGTGEEGADETFASSESDPNATFVCIGGYSEWNGPFFMTATRSVLGGYELGSQDQKPLSGAEYAVLNGRGFGEWVAKDGNGDVISLSGDTLRWEYYGIWGWVFNPNVAYAPIGGGYLDTDISFNPVDHGLANYVGPITLHRDVTPGYILGPLDGVNASKPVAAASDAVLSARQQGGYVLGSQSDKPLAKAGDTILSIRGYSQNWTVTPSSIDVEYPTGEIDPETGEGTTFTETVTSDYYEPQYGDPMGAGDGDEWYFADEYSMPNTLGSSDPNAHSFTYTFNGQTVTATRAALPGYVLGSQTSKPLADANHTHSYNDLTDKPTIPAAPGTLNTDNTSAQTASSSESLSGTVSLHRVSKTGSYNDLLNKPTIPSISGLESTSNKVTSVSSSSTDVQYPSAKCVYDNLDEIEDGLSSILNDEVDSNDQSYTAGGLSGLPDVAISSVADGQVLKYDGTSGKWVNAAESGGGGGGGGGTLYGTFTLDGHMNSDGNISFGGVSYVPFHRYGSTSSVYTVAVPDGTTVSIDYGGYTSECELYKNGVAATKSSSVVVNAGDAYWLVFNSCLSPDTLILMDDKSSKPLLSVRPGDVVATPFGPDEVTEVSFGVGDHMDVWSFSDGTKVETVGRHRFYNHDLGEPMYLEAWNMGEHALCSDGTMASLVGHVHENGEFRHGTLFTRKWNLYYANGLLAGNRKSKDCDKLCQSM